MLEVFPCNTNRLGKDQEEEKCTDGDGRGRRIAARRG